MENYTLKFSSKVIAGTLIALGIFMTVMSFVPICFYGDLVFSFILVFAVPLLIWGFMARGRSFKCNDEQFEVAGCVKEVKSGYEEVKVKIPSLTLRWDEVKSYSYKSGFSGGYITVNTQDEKKYHISISYLIERGLFGKGYMAILEQFESKLGMTEKTAEQKEKQNNWIIVITTIAVLLLLLKYIL